MRHQTCRLVFMLATMFLLSRYLLAQPISLHPENTHYFLWQGKPRILITSGEHYGSVLNLDFDYRKYIDTLAQDGLLLTRTFSGAYVEPEGAFNIAKNTLAPLPGRFICPWARSNENGYANGGNKFDLTKWDESYLERLKDFVSYANKKGVVVEFTLFCPMYEDKQWNLSPMNMVNNVNGVGNVFRDDVHTLDKTGNLLPVQEELVRKLVAELNSYDNVIFEICNEPYFGGVTLDWQNHIAALIVETEKDLPKKHLISQNIANNKASIENPNPAISVFNFHYAAPPDTVGMNYHLNKVIGDNETGFRGTGNFVYRSEAWDFVIAGGGLFNNLDYSFVAGHEDGTFEYPAQQPGGGNPQFRREMKILNDFIHAMNFLAMKPDNSIIQNKLPSGVTARTLVELGKTIAIYVRSESTKAEKTILEVVLADGDWRGEWLDTKTGSVIEKIELHGGRVVEIKSPEFVQDIALRILLQ